MSREIKFRAWDKEQQEMHYSDRKTPYNIWFSLDDGKVECLKNHAFCDTFGYECDRWESIGDIEQFTGLHDKNGVEVYEGDKLRADGYWDIFIEFENGSFVCKALNKIQYANKTINIPISNFDLLRFYEVIGNIHERNEDNEK